MELLSKDLLCFMLNINDTVYDELGDVLDSIIGTGGMSKEEYQAKVKDFVCSVSIDFLK